MTSDPKLQDVTDITYQSLAYRQMRDRALEEVKEREQAENALKTAHQDSGSPHRSL